MYTGGRIGVFNGNPKHLIADLQLLRPTLVALVPRVLNRFYEQIQADVENSGAITRLLFGAALKVKHLKTFN